jgi:vitamin B12 transporter
VLLLSLFLLATPLAGAPTPADTVVVEAGLPEVSVVATRTAVPPAEAPARVTVLGAGDVVATSSRSVADLLERATGAFVRRYGPGGLASLSLRGTGASQTLVLLDGHRIADPQLGQLDLALLPTVLLERVEVMHGAGSALHGTDGMGGVVDLRTLRADRDRLELASTLGAFSERALSGRVARAGRSVGVVVAAEALTEEGDFPYFDPNRGARGETLRRVGADRTLGSVFARAEGEAGRTTAHVALWAGAAERGVPGSIGAPTDARQEDRHVRLWGGTTTRYGWGTLRAGGLVQRASLRYNAEEGRTWIGSAEVEAQRLVARWLLATGLTGGLGAAEHPSLTDDAREGRLGAFVSATGDFGALLLYPALRADVYLRSGPSEPMLTAVSPRLGANWRPSPALPLRLKAAAGTAFRAPTFNDRFWRYADPYAPAGDPDLRPELGWTADLGAHLGLGRFDAEVTAFAARTRDQIVWLPGQTGLFAPQNIGRTETLGLEATARGGHQIGAVRLGGHLAYALTDARDRSLVATTSYGQPLRYVPRHRASGRLGASAPVALHTAVRLDLGARHVGTRPITADGSFVEPSHTVVDVRLSATRAFGAASATLGLDVENALDAEYVVLRGYPMPPRHARLRLQVSL